MTTQNGVEIVVKDTRLFAFIALGLLLQGTPVEASNKNAPLPPMKSISGYFKPPPMCSSTYEFPFSTKLLQLCIKDLKRNKRLWKTGYILRHFGSKARPAVPAMLQAVERHKHVLRPITLALIRIGWAPKRSLPRLLRLISRPNLQTYKGLGNLFQGMGTRAVPPLLRILQTPGAKGKEIAIIGLGRIGSKARASVPTLVKAFDGKYSAAASDALVRIGRAALPSLRRALKHKKGWVRYQAVATLAKHPHKGKREERALLQVLLHKEKHLLYDATCGLGSLPSISPRTRRALKLQLKSHEWRNRLVAAWALRHHFPTHQRSIKVLLGGLKHQKEYVVREALWWIHKLGTKAKEAIPPLLAMLHGKQLVSKDRIISALGAVGAKPAQASPLFLKLLKQDRSYNQLRNSLTHAIADTFRQMGSPVVPFMLTMARGSVQKPKVIGVWVLGALGPAAKQAIPLLLRIAATTQQPQLREIASDGLTRMAPHTYRTLLQALSHPKPRYRERAAALIGEFRHLAKPTIPKLLSLLNENDESIRVAAAKSLGKIGKPAFKGLFSLLQQGTERQAKHAAQVLGRKNAIQELARAIEFKGWRGKIALHEFCALGPRVKALLPKLIRVLQKYIHRSLATNCLRRIGTTPKVDSLLVQMLKGKSAKERSMAIFTTNALRTWDSHKISLLFLALTDPNDNIKALAYHTIQQVRKRALPALRNALRTQNPKHRAAAIQAIKPMGLPQQHAISILRLMNKDPHWLVRKAVVNGLCQQGTKAHPHLIRAAYDKDRRVRQHVIHCFRLTNTESNRAFRFLCRMLKKGSWRMRKATSKALEFWDPRAIPFLSQALKDKHAAVRKQALQSLLTFGHKALPALIKLTKSKNTNLQRYGIKGLKELGREFCRSSDPKCKRSCLQLRQALKQLPR